MMKQLSVVVTLLFAVACKTDAPAPAASSTSPAAESSGKARSAKIDIKPVAPAAPSVPGAAQPAEPGTDEPGPRVDRGERMDPAEREAWRERRKARLDSDGDGAISDAERGAAMQQRMASMHTRFDADGDGKLTPAELGASGGRMRFDDPTTLDTNRDGDISADELSAAMKARREQRRLERGSAAPTAP